MGTIFAPTYATLPMGYFELPLYIICINEFGDQFVFENWSLCLDDCQIPLDKTKIDPNRLLEILNSINPYIKFTKETSDKEPPFLDIFIKRNNDKIWMAIYFKPKDTRWCLLFSSSHSNHCKRNIQFTVARRICIIVENQQQKL